MTWFLTFADLALALALFWHSANSPDREPALRAMLYAFAFGATCFGAARFLALAGADRDAWQWMVDIGHLAMIAFGILLFARETGRMAKLKGN